MKKILLLTQILVFLTLNLSAQAVDNQQIKRDSTPSVSTTKTTKNGLFNKSKKVSNDSFPVPKKALLWAIVPAGGQFYVRKGWWWKAPIVLGGFGGSVYAINFNTKAYKQFKEAYYNTVNKLPLNDPEIPDGYPAEKLKQYRDSYYKQLQQSYIAVGVTYLISGVWAFSDAHLAHFDVKDDLSFKLKPSFEPMPYGNAIGFGINLKF